MESPEESFQHISVFDGGDLDIEGVLINLAKARTLSEVRSSIECLEHSFGFSWRPVGDRETNYGLINIGSDPGLAFVERITNSIDAVIERAAEESSPELISTLRNPRDAAQKLFSIVEGRIVKLTSQQRDEMSKRIVIRILDGSSPETPTLEVIDHGIGISAEQMPLSLLSLGNSNKIGKPYLAGAYGQGGSTTYAFCNGGAVLMSASGSSDVAITYVRYNELDPRINKNGRYEYLVNPANEVAAISRNLCAFEQGCLVRHFDYELTNHSQRMTQLQKSLWSLSHTALFDPILPFTLVEARERFRKTSKGSEDRRTVWGTYARLFTDKRDKVEYSESCIIPIRTSSESGRISVHYWVLRQDAETTGDPTASYVNASTPVILTNFGQTHGYEDRRFIVENLRLPFLKSSLIIQIELDGLSASAKRELLSTTRDRMKKGALYSNLVESVSEALRDDADLDRINRERRSSVLSKSSIADQEKLKRRFAELMEKFQTGKDAEKTGPGVGEKQRPPSPPSPPMPLAPLVTSDKPTFIKIANKIRPIELRDNRLAILSIESDAPDTYLISSGSRLSVITDPPQIVEVVRHTDFHGGRARIALRLRGGKINDVGKVVSFLLTSDDSTFSDQINFKITENANDDDAGKDGKGGVRTPRIEPVQQSGWKDLEWTEQSVVRVSESRDDTIIFVNVDNVHLRKLLQAATYQETGLNRMRNNFALYCAFFGYLRAIRTEGRFTDFPSDVLSDYQDLEDDRLAQTVISSIAAVERVEQLAFSVF